MKVTTGIVKSYDWKRGEWLISLGDGRGSVLVDWEDWHWAALWVGEQITFQMIHKPKGVYALPVNASNDTEAGPKV